MFDIQAKTKSKYYDLIVLLYLEDKTGSTEKTIVGTHRKVVADRVGTNVRK
jgi:hypothetical protein